MLMYLTKDDDQNSSVKEHHATWWRWRQVYTLYSLSGPHDFDRMGCFQRCSSNNVRVTAGFLYIPAEYSYMNTFRNLASNVNRCTCFSIRFGNSKSALLGGNSPGANSVQGVSSTISTASQTHNITIVYEHYQSVYNQTRHFCRNKCFDAFWYFLLLKM